jgi:hypothetical protein
LLEALRQSLCLDQLPAASAAWAWSPEILVVAALLMTWQAAKSLGERFGAVRDLLVELYPGCRIGTTYQGWIKALLRASRWLLRWLSDRLRGELRGWAGPYWTREGWLAFAADGSRIECPRTEANEKELGCAGKKRTTPQLFLTALYHMGTGLLWDFEVGPGTDSERAHLRSMLWRLPACALIVADAGFVGYDLLRAITSGGRSFLIRVGNNVHLLKELGHAHVEKGGIVYLWPQDKRKRHQPPLVLRLIEFHNGRRPVFLLTNVLDEQALSYEQASVLYRMRWGVEIFFRSMKQTLARRTMCSKAPRKARCELQWTVMGLWVLARISAEQIIRAGHDPLGLSVALARRRVRQAMRQTGRSARSPALLKQLGQALKDSYLRTRPKKARDWPHKKTEKPPGAPNIRSATAQEIHDAQALDIDNVAA